MIKNWESATRSRARKQVGCQFSVFLNCTALLFSFFISFLLLFCILNKLRVDDEQAYTNELENKVSRLEEENERLRKRKVYIFF